MALSLAAGHVGELVAGGEVPEHDAIDELTYAAQLTGLGVREISVTIAKGLRRGARTPRGSAPGIECCFDWGAAMRAHLAAFNATQ
jgi:hypothetical protein